MCGRCNVKGSSAYSDASSQHTARAVRNSYSICICILICTTLYPSSACRPANARDVLSNLSSLIQNTILHNFFHTFLPSSHHAA